MAVAPSGTADTFPKLLRANATTLAGSPANREKEYGIWQSWTWAEAYEETRALALGLRDLGLKPGEHAAIIGANRPRLYWAMTATQMTGAIPVPIYQDGTAEEVQYVLDHAEATFVFAEDQEQVDKIFAIQERLPNLRHIIYCDPRGLRKYDHAALHPYEEVQKRGRDNEAAHGAELDRITESTTGSDTCIMLYTSGTTGQPKGVVLTHDNLLITARAATEFDGLISTDSTIAYLPMAWIGDFMLTVGQSYVTGMCTACPENQDTMMHDMREIGPTYFFAPPRIFEGLLTSLTIRMEDAGKVKKWLFKAFIAHAKSVSAKRSAGKSPSIVDRLLLGLGEILVYGPLKNTLGMSRIRVGYTAGEAVGADLFEFYRSIGINLKQLYGQTEASVFITQHPDDAVELQTVGVPTPGVDIRVADSGEVFYRSPGVFKEYYKNPKATAKARDAKGWVATGDAGFMDERSGQLRILDRAKDVGKTASGALFAPKYVENKLKFFPNIFEAVVFGDGRDTCTAILNIDLNAVGNWAERNNIAYSSYMELAGHPKVLDMMQSHVEETNSALAREPMLSACQISRFLVLHKQLDADDGELTRTQKIRRTTIGEKYRDLVKALYSGAKEVATTTEVTYEDGRKGSISATLKLRDAKTFAPQESTNSKPIAAE